ncbi:MAG: carbohydrate-binding protein [Micropruina sp.]|nr:carbohydrate-binding protein [Micropruina sp.]
MRKKIIDPAHAVDQSDWLDLEALAEVEITSEDAAHPIEAALIPGQVGGWRAATPGEQTIRLSFAVPQALKRVRVEFIELAVARSQEYLLRASEDAGVTFRDIVRQQWNFSPQGGSHEAEEHEVNLAGVTVLELVITPDRDGGGAHASLDKLRLR